MTILIRFEASSQTFSWKSELKLIDIIDIDRKMNLNFSLFCQFSLENSTKLPAKMPQIEKLKPIFYNYNDYLNFINLSLQGSR